MNVHEFYCMGGKNHEGICPGEKQYREYMEEWAAEGIRPQGEPMTIMDLSKTATKPMTAIEIMEIMQKIADKIK